MKCFSSCLFILLFLVTLNTRAQPLLSGVFQASEAELTYKGPLSWSAFSISNDSLNKNGYRLYDLETFMVDGTRKFWGSWIKSTHEASLESVQGWANLVKTKRAKAAEGFLLTEILGYSVSNNEDHFIGVWLKTEKLHKVWKLDSREGLIKKTEEMARQDFFIVDVEVFAAPNKTLSFLALYHKGEVTTPRNYVFTSSDLPAFKTSLLQREKSGFRMVDFESFEEKEKTWYLGVFEKGDYETVFLHGQQKSDFDERWDILEEQGMKLIDFEYEK